MAKSINPFIKPVNTAVTSIYGSRTQFSAKTDNIINI